MRLAFEFLLRWISTSFGLWIAIRLLGTGDGAATIGSVSNVFLVAGLLLSLINILIKPIVSIISLPITILTLGLFTLIINGLMVYLALYLTPGIEITFWSAVLAGIVIGVVNFVINQTFGALKVANKE